ISRLRQKDGEAVRADEPLLEVETETAAPQVSAPQAGTLRISVPEGQTVAVGAVVGRIEEGAAGGRPESTGRKDGTATKPAKAKPDGAAVPPRAATSPKPKQKADVEAAPSEAPQRADAEEEVLLSPSARHLAKEKGVDVRQLTGTGASGRITKEDVLGYLEQQRPKETAAPSPAPQAKDRELAAPPPSA